MAAAIDDFDASLIINPLTYDEAKNRRMLEESLESIISGAALLADSRYKVYNSLIHSAQSCVLPVSSPVDLLPCSNKSTEKKLANASLCIGWEG